MAAGIGRVDEQWALLVSRISLRKDVMVIENTVCPEHVGVMYEREIAALEVKAVQAKLISAHFDRPTARID